MTLSPRAGSVLTASTSLSARLRTAALLAFERRELATAARLTEDILGMLGGGRPHFGYFAQLDRARIWAAGGNLDEALASLPAARTALKSDRSVLLAQADELEVRFRLALGDQRGALALAERLPDDRGIVLSAIIALGAQDPRSAAEALSRAPARGPTIRADLEITTPARQHRRHPRLIPGTPTGQRGSRHRRAPRLRPNSAGDGPPAGRPPGLRLDRLRKHRQPQGLGRGRSASPQAR